MIEVGGKAQSMPVVRIRLWDRVRIPRGAWGKNGVPRTFNGFGHIIEFSPDGEWSLIEAEGGCLLPMPTRHLLPLRAPVGRRRARGLR